MLCVHLCLFVYIETYFLSEHTPLSISCGCSLSCTTLLCVDRALTDNNFWSYFACCYWLEVCAFYFPENCSQYILYRNSIHGAVCIRAFLGEKMCTHVLLTMCSSVIYVWTTPVEHQGMAPGLWGQPLACLHACSRESHAQLGFHRLINFSINFWFLNVCSDVIQERRKLLIVLCSVLDIWQSECGEVCGHFCLQKTKNSNWLHSGKIETQNSKYLV